MVKFWICLVIGVFCILAWLGGREEAAGTLKWPSAPGVVTEMGVHESRSSDGGVNRQGFVKYSYTVAGRIYQGDRVKVEASTEPSSAERYPKGTPVAVFYNPAKPSDSVLEQGGPGMLMWGVTGIGLVLYAAYTFIKRFKSPAIPSPLPVIATGTNE